MENLTTVLPQKRNRFLETIFLVEVVIAVAFLVFLAVVLKKPVSEAIWAAHVFLTTPDM